MVPGKRMGSWARKVIRERRAWREMVDMSIPSMMMRPSDGRVVASNANASVLFPDPVRPMRAVVDPPLIVNEMLDSAGSR